MTKQLFSVILYVMRELIKENNGVKIYKDGNMLSMYIEDYKVLEIDEQFRMILDKSYDNLVQIRKQGSNE